jgi:putative oxidoreductase
MGFAMEGVAPAAGEWVLLILRVWTGGWLVLYALRSSFGYFPNTGVPVQSVQGTADYMDRFGWKPGIFWAWLSTLNNVAGGTLLAVGLFTPVVAATCALLLTLSAAHHARKDGIFANQNGLEHYALWALCAALFVVQGGGPYSLDAILLSPR